MNHPVPSSGATRGAVLLATVSLLACGGPRREVAARSQTAQTVQAADDVVGFEYPPARWRLATFDELDRTTLWISHIAIRHEQSDARTFRVNDWHPDPPAPRRSVAEALRIAEGLAAEAARAPSTFAQLARHHSEDVVTRDRGGALGGVRASQLTTTGFLDVLAQLRPGEVSRAFRTPFGFHVLKREPAPPAAQVAGARIVIAYEGAQGTVGPARRTREEARQLADTVATQARATPASFAALVGRFSDGPERSRRGALGVFSTLDPEYLPSEVAELATLAVGEVSAPIESRFGFEILMRVKPQPRPEFALTAVELAFDPGADGADQIREAAWAAAQEASRLLRKDPSRFAELQTTHCCAGVKRLRWGRAPEDVVAALDRLRFGQIAPQPVLDEQSFLIVKRLDPSKVPPAPARLTELPQPVTPDFDAFLDYNESGQMAAMTRSFVEALGARSELAAIAAKAAPILNRLAAELATNPEGSDLKRGQVQGAMAALRTALGEAQFDQFARFATDWAVDQMMPPRLAAGP